MTRPPKVCAECGEGLPRDRTRQQDFCGDACRSAFNNRRKRRGAILYDLAMDMRVNRRPGSFTRLQQQIDQFIREDRDAGRKAFNAVNPERPCQTTKG
ncbi:MAG: DUF2116 family Zn-ribbon domain-containing protein [Sphingomonadales bacterium]|nr:DUF2116 family Zn-ribbon domain-containing protein [Sphingomonadales bacterium]